MSVLQQHAHCAKKKKKKKRKKEREREMGAAYSSEQIKTSIERSKQRLIHVLFQKMSFETKFVGANRRRKRHSFHR